MLTRCANWDPRVLRWVLRYFATAESCIFSCRIPEQSDRMFRYVLVAKYLKHSVRVFRSVLVPALCHCGIAEHPEWMLGPVQVAK